MQICCFSVQIFTDGLTQQDENIKGLVANEEESFQLD
jgi:hypothetical protein